MKGGEREYYSRQLRLSDFSESDQQKLNSTGVLVIGLGGLGSIAADLLAGVGVGNLVLVDGDRVSRSNLARQGLYTSDDIAKPKSELAKSRLEKRNPFISIESINSFFNPGLAKELVPSVDLVLDCSDNFPTRYLVNDACVEFEKPFVFGGIDRDLIQWAVFNYQSGPTYRCLHPDEPLASFIKSCNDRGVLSMTPALLGSIQARESLKVLLNDSSLDQFFFNILNTKSWDLQRFQASRTAEAEKARIRESYGGWCNSGGVKEVGIDSVEQLGACLVDVRETSEYERFHLESSINFPLSTLAQNYQELPKNQALILYCQTGQRSITAAEMLQKNGFEQVYSLRFGIEEMVPDLSS